MIVVVAIKNVQTTLEEIAHRNTNQLHTVYNAGCVQVASELLTFYSCFRLDTKSMNNFVIIGLGNEQI